MWDSGARIDQDNTFEQGCPLRCGPKLSESLWNPTSPTKYLIWPRATLNLARSDWPEPICQMANKAKNAPERHPQPPTCVAGNYLPETQHASENRSLHSTQARDNSFVLRLCLRGIVLMTSARWNINLIPENGARAKIWEANDGSQLERTKAAENNHCEQSSRQVKAAAQGSRRH
jgi:hypothetical protein